MEITEALDKTVFIFKLFTVIFEIAQNRSTPTMAILESF